MVFINLPCASLPASKTFYTALGFTSDERFTTPLTCMIKLSAHINVMLHDSGARFTDFMPSGRRVSNAKTHTEVLLALSCKERGEVDGWVERAGRAGGTVDVGFRNEMVGADGTCYMYGRSFDDLDGHVWEVVWMHEKAVENVEILREEKGNEEGKREEKGEGEMGEEKDVKEQREKDVKEPKEKNVMEKEEKGFKDIKEEME
jgi:uncharacterized protein